jgi:putative DNA primase/helicase
VSDFLAEILAGGPVDVLEVERQARAAALLGEDKRLRQNKAFRDAREALGVIAAREGFGPGARYGKCETPQTKPANSTFTASSNFC